jgi:hypothetical protein
VSQPTYDLVPTHLAVKAMRDNGYRNTAYAVAELIDNSLQAGATSVELLCAEAEDFVQQRVRRRIRQIAVLDNGRGMNAADLRAALQFGNGSHLDDRSGIGRFGMGLPSASISQCRRVDVWTWQTTPNSAIYTYIDLDEVEDGTFQQVPTPAPADIPEVWRAAAETIGKSGTLVVWSTLDRCMWRTAASVIKNSEFLIARMYRSFLASGTATIRLAAFDDRRPDTATIDDYATANDPGYLLVPSSTPAPYDNIALFKEDGDAAVVEQVISYAGQEHTVKIRFSYAKEEARDRPNAAGQTDYGKHAAKNVGVSLVRADRELDMDQALVISYDARERWWGVEVDFPPSLDELFGVTNNKQAARNFSEVAKNLQSLVGPGGQQGALFEAMAEDEDPTLPLIEILLLIDRRLGVLRNLLKVQTQGSKIARRRHDPSSPEAQGTEVTRDRQKDGHRGFSDEDENRPAEERTEALAKELEETGLPAEQAQELAARTISTGIKYTFAEADLEGRAFFTVKPVAGEIVIKLNVRHPAYANLVEVLEQDVEEELDESALRHRLQSANRGLKLLLMAWARYEDEQPNEERREQIQDIRTDWGRVAANFLRSD